MTVVFVCSPYGGREENVEAALNYCYMEVALGNVPFAPHCFYPRFMSEDTERYEAMQMGLEMLSRCDEIHVYGDAVTPGMMVELEYAQDNGIPITYIEVAR